LATHPFVPMKAWVKNTVAESRARGEGGQIAVFYRTSSCCHNVTAHKCICCATSLPQTRKCMGRQISAKLRCVRGSLVDLIAGRGRQVDFIGMGPSIRPNLCRREQRFNQPGGNVGRVVLTGSPGRQLCITSFIFGRTMTSRGGERNFEWKFGTWPQGSPSFGLRLPAMRRALQGGSRGGLPSEDKAGVHSFANVATRLK